MKHAGDEAAAGAGQPASRPIAVPVPYCSAMRWPRARCRAPPDRADREVDAAGQDDEQHADRHDAGAGDLAQHVEDVALGQEDCRTSERATTTSTTKMPQRAVALQQFGDVDSGWTAACRVVRSWRSSLSSGPHSSRVAAASSPATAGFPRCSRSGGSSPRISPSPHDQHAVAQAEQFLMLRRDDEHRLALGGERA